MEKIGIIGGKGAMGRWFEKFFTDAGYNILISDLNTTLTSENIAAQCEVVIISVPIDVAEKVAEQVGPLLQENQLLTDLCSLKEDIVKAMLRSTKAQVVGMHPLFGPFMDSIKGRNIILCPARGTSWLDWIENIFEKHGAVVSRMDAVTHDKNMAVFQGLTHLLSVGMGRTLQKMNLTPDKVISCATPVFRINLDLIGRLFAQDLDLYRNLIGQNKYVAEVLDIFLSSMQEGRECLLSGNKNKKDLLEDIREFFGTFCNDALEESNAFLNICDSRKKED